MRIADEWNCPRFMSSGGLGISPVEPSGFAAKHIQLIYREMFVPATT
jgi:hypothetical protein